MQNELTIDMITREMVRLIRNQIPWAVTLDAAPKNAKTKQFNVNVRLQSDDILRSSLDDFAEEILMPMSQKIVPKLNFERIDYYLKLPLPKNCICCVTGYDGFTLRGIITHELLWEDRTANYVKTIQFDCLCIVPDPPKFI